MQRSQISFGPQLTPMVKKLLIITAGIFLAGLLIRQIFPEPVAMVYGFLALQPHRVLTDGWVWQILTYAFVHTTLGHVFWNMLALWMFGCEVEGQWGRRPFLAFYLLCVAGGGIGCLVQALLFTPPDFVLGASAAVLGLVVAYGMLFADRSISLLFPPVTLKAKWLAIGWIVLDFLFFLDGGRQQVSYAAHVGGIVAAFLYMKSRFRFSPSARLRIRGLTLGEYFKRWRSRRHLRVIEDNDEHRGPTLH